MDLLCETDLWTVNNWRERPFRFVKGKCFKIFKISLLILHLKSMDECTLLSSVLMHNPVHLHMYEERCIMKPVSFIIFFPQKHAVYRQIEKCSVISLRRFKAHLLHFVICRPPHGGGHAALVMIYRIPSSRGFSNIWSNNTLFRSCSRIYELHSCQELRVSSRAPGADHPPLSSLLKNQREIIFLDGYPLSSSALCLLLHPRKIKVS